MDLYSLFQDVTGAISRHNDPNQPDYPQGGLMGAVQNLFSSHAANNNLPFGGGTLPASQDPYGDPAGNIAPASQDPYGDPGAGYGGNVRPASQDPYGDPG